MRSGVREPAVAHMRFQIIERAAADERKPALEPVAQALQASGEIRGNVDSVRRGSDLDQRAVEVDEQRHWPLRQQFGQFGWGWKRIWLGHRGPA